MDLERLAEARQLVSDAERLEDARLEHLAVVLRLAVAELDDQLALLDVELEQRLRPLLDDQIVGGAAADHERRVRDAEAAAACTLEDVATGAVRRRRLRLDLHGERQPRHPEHVAVGEQLWLVARLAVDRD